IDDARQPIRQDAQHRAHAGQEEHRRYRQLNHVRDRGNARLCWHLRESSRTQSTIAVITRITPASAATAIQNTVFDHGNIGYGYPSLTYDAIADACPGPA